MMGKLSEKQLIALLRPGLKKLDEEDEMKNKHGETICSICERTVNGRYIIWRKLENGEHHYICKECEDTIPC